MRLVFCLIFCLIFSTLFISRPAAAAPTEIESLLHSVFRSVVSTSSPELVAPYLAIARDRNRWFVRAACDDDGDHVIVLSEGIVNLVRDLARSESALRAATEYRELLERNKTRDAAALPPPPGFFGEPVNVDTERHRARSMFAYLLAHELTRFESGEPVCTHPDRLRESGDDEWTANEQVSLDYHQQITEDGPEVLEAPLVAHMDLKKTSLDGALELLTFFAEIERFFGKDRLARATMRDSRSRLDRLRAYGAVQKDVRMPPLPR